MRHTKNKLPKRLTRFIFLTLIFVLMGGISLGGQKPLSVSAQVVHTCLNPVDIPLGDLHWVYVPQSPEELYTEEQYFFLAGQLISNNIVDASSCPSGGLMANGYANACGMAQARETVVAVQNLLNEPILQAYDDVGVPPVLLKNLIRFESQFWPSQDGIIHYGFGHLTNIGIRNALQWNPDLYAKVCPDSVDDCVTNFSAAEAILSSLIATCEDCEYGIDQAQANQSLDILAESLLGYCFQTEQLVFNATGWRSNLAVDYATIWKLTLMNYNVGSVCVYNTLESTFDRTQGPMNWSDISASVPSGYCERGLYYANQVTDKYFDFPPLEP
jgi:hypothetical protein